MRSPALTLPRWLLVTSLWLAAGQAFAVEDPAPAPPAESLTFERDIRPILRAHCLDCHGATSELKGGLDLRLVRFIQKGGESGPALTAGQPDQSLMLQRIQASEMPPGDSKVSAAELERLQRWIAAGAPTARPEPEQIAPGLGITPEERAFWSFQPIRRPEVPAFPESERIRTPIDALLRQAMPEGLAFSPDADKLTLVRRVYLDLLGLPPTQQQITQFLQDESPDAYEKLVDDLLRSPHYGERWARHWLDVAGYADSDGYTTADAVRPWAYRYRDYVIRALNDDKPFDRFLAEQLVGDELAGPRQGDWTPEQIDLLTATGFLRMAADGTGSGDDSPEARNQTVADTIKIVSSSLFGLTVACAQCHDHRYDPIPQTDYYALRAVFEPALDWQTWLTPQQRQVSLYTEADRQKSAEIETRAQSVQAERDQKQAEYMAAALEKELQKYDEAMREPLRVAYKTPADQRSAEQNELLAKNPSVNISPGVLYQYDQAAADDLKKYDERMAQIRAEKPVEQYLHTLTEPAGHLPETRLFHRGDHRQPTDLIPPGTLSVLCPEGQSSVFPADDPNLPTSGRRLAFARWLTGPDNPLTARVLVNRIWLHHFGRGLVDTAGDFGTLGTRPTHAELLDWLADEFRREGWGLKKLHKTILLSTVYRQSSARDAARDAIDPENRFYWRKPLVRLDAETLRDRMLAVTGQLDPTLFGPSIGIKEDDTGQVVVDGEQRRRSVYIQVRRSQPVAMMQSFDAPVMATNCERRPSSTVATQSLILMNGEFALAQAAKFAARVRQEAPGTLDPQLWSGLPELAQPAVEGQPAVAGLTAQAAYAWQLAFCRPPSREELQVAIEFLQQQSELYASGGATLPENTTAAQQVMTNLCHVLLGANEFLYVD